MSSYAEIFYLLGAMVVFSFLSLNTARSFNSSRQTLYQAEAEYRAIAVVQDELDKVQWIYEPDDLDPSSGSYVYSSYPIEESHTYGDSDQLEKNSLRSSSPTCRAKFRSCVATHPNPH
jgi:hypothetical protein